MKILRNSKAPRNAPHKVFFFAKASKRGVRSVGCKDQNLQGRQGLEVKGLICQEIFSCLFNSLFKFLSCFLFLMLFVVFFLVCLLFVVAFSFLFFFKHRHMPAFLVCFLFFFVVQTWAYNQWCMVFLDVIYVLVNYCWF